LTGLVKTELSEFCGDDYARTRKESKGKAKVHAKHDDMLELRQGSAGQKYWARLQLVAARRAC